MKQNYTHISFILDRSGSMLKARDITIEGFNAFLHKQQQVKGTGTMTLVQFDDQYEVNYDFLPLEKAKYLTEATYEPRGWTALLDAIGRTIDSTGRRLAAMSEDERPDRVIVVIQTDGLENRSTEYVTPAPFGSTLSAIANVEWDKGARVRDMIKHQQDKYNWDFVFLGSGGMDALKVAASYGINAKSAMSYDAGSTRSAFASAANYTTSFRCASNIDAAKMTCFSQDDRDAAIGADVQTTTTNKAETRTRKPKGQTIA